MGALKSKETEVPSRLPHFGCVRVILTSLFVLMSLLCSAQTHSSLQVRVIIENANIRTRPELDSEILNIAAKGTVFEVIEKAGSWYAVKMGEDSIGHSVYGYIHESMVDPNGEVVVISEAQSEPSPAPQEVRGAPVRVRRFRKLLSGSFLNCGFGHHWLASFGFDVGIGRHLGIGLEFQPYFRDLAALETAVIQMDTFVNLKLGFKVWILTFYGGGGIGPGFSYTSTVIDDQTHSYFRTRLTYHGLAGTSIDVGKMAIVFEYQPTLIEDFDLKRDTWGHFFFVGLRF